MFEPLVKFCKHTATRGFLLIYLILRGLNSFHHGCFLGFLLMLEQKKKKLTFIFVLISKFHHFYFPFSGFGLLSYAFSRLHLVLSQIFGDSCTNTLCQYLAVFGSASAVKQHPNDLIKN